MGAPAAMRSYKLTRFGAPLSEVIESPPAPNETQVLLRVSACGVCHSDLHVADGFFDLGQGQKYDLSAAVKLPRILGHEIAGVVEAAGENVEGAVVGRQVAIYPWIGCGQCAACRAGEENMCSAHHHLGVAVDGGYASYVMVPHPRYLIDHAPLAPSFAGPLMCSGLTAYGALKRLGSHAERGPALLVGLGGVGMMGLALARVLFREAPLVADIDAEKRKAALGAGAAQAFDPADPQTRKAILAASGGGLFAVCDFVGSDKSLQFATGVLARGGKVVVTGLLGGSFSIPAAMFGIKAITIEGTLTGTLAQARELVALARSGKIAPIPTQARPLDQAQTALDDLRAGRVVGRTVLTT